MTVRRNPVKSKEHWLAMLVTTSEDPGLRPSMEGAHGAVFPLHTPSISKFGIQNQKHTAGKNECLHVNLILASHGSAFKKLSSRGAPRWRRLDRSRRNPMTTTLTELEIQSFKNQKLNGSRVNYQHRTRMFGHKVSQLT